MVTSLGAMFQVDWGKEVRVLSKQNFCRNSLLVLKSTPRGHELVDLRPFRLKIWPRFWRSNVWTVYSRLNFSIVIVAPCKPNTWTYELFNRKKFVRSRVNPEVYIILVVIRKPNPIIVSLIIQNISKLRTKDILPLKHLATSGPQGRDVDYSWYSSFSSFRPSKVVFLYILAIVFSQSFGYFIWHITWKYSVLLFNSVVPKQLSQRAASVCVSCLCVPRKGC